MTQFKAIIISLFPQIFPGPLQYSLAGKGLDNNIWQLELIDLRDFGIGKHQQVDDTAYGGGSGLIMRADVLCRAIEQARMLAPTATIYYPSPRGPVLSQPIIKQLAQQKEIIILCGRFEGIDERVIDEYNIQQISIGNFILSGGETAALAILDSVIRLLPGIVKNTESLQEESFERQCLGVKLVEHPLYTKPATWHGRKVPAVLSSGNHQKIADWKSIQALKSTLVREIKLLKLAKQNIF